MRSPSQLVVELLVDLKLRPGDSIAQHASHGGQEYWPELRDEEFRVELEALMMEVPEVQRVFFTPPEKGMDWAFYVVPK